MTKAGRPQAGTRNRIASFAFAHPFLLLSRPPRASESHQCRSSQHSAQHLPRRSHSSGRDQPRQGPSSSLLPIFLPGALRPQSDPFPFHSYSFSTESLERCFYGPGCECAARERTSRPRANVNSSFLSCVFSPGYLVSALSNCDWVTWIFPKNVLVNQVFGYSHGLGLSLLTFDCSCRASFAPSCFEMTPSFTYILFRGSHIDPWKSSRHSLVGLCKCCGRSESNSSELVVASRHEADSPCSSSVQLIGFVLILYPSLYYSGGWYRGLPPLP